MYAFEWNYKLKEPVKTVTKENPMTDMMKQALLEKAKMLEEQEKQKNVKKSSLCSIF